MWRPVDLPALPLQSSIPEQATTISEPWVPMLFILYEDKLNFFLEPLKEPSRMTDKFWSSILTQLHTRDAERPTVDRDDPPVAYFLSTKCSQHEVLVELFLYIYFKKARARTHTHPWVSDFSSLVYFGVYHPALLPNILSHGQHQHFHHLFSGRN